MPRGIGGHHNPVANTHDWITPRFVLDALGRFDLDPCQSLTQPWPCADNGYTVVDDGLKQEWLGRCFVNPPYGTYAIPFLERLASHKNGIGLLFGRTETEMFRSHIWQQADAILFLHGRLTFHRPDGTKAGGNSGGPSVLIAYGKKNVTALDECGLAGALVINWKIKHERQLQTRPRDQS